MKPPTSRGKRIIKINAISFAKLVRYMIPGLYTLDQLAEKTGLFKKTVMHYARELHREKVVHIARYEKDSAGRRSKIVYKFGDCEDAPRVRQTGAEAMKRYREKKQGIQKIETNWKT